MGSAFVSLSLCVSSSTSPARIMACDRGVLPAIFSLITLIFALAAVAPEVHWSKGDEDSSVSLWKICAGSHCTKWSDTSDLKKIKHDHALRDRDGALAGNVICSVFSFLALFPLCCHHRKTAVAFNSIALLFTVVAIGCWAHLQNSELPEEGHWKFGPGFILTALAAVTGFLAVVTSCCVRTNVDYEYLA